MKESLSVRFLYRTVVGRVILKVLVQPGISKMAGLFLDSRLSTGIIPSFTKNNNIDMEGVIVPEKGFSSFNEFFCRKREPLNISSTTEELVSPCDGFLTCMPIRRNMIFDIKHTKFSLESLLKDKALAEEFYDGTAYVFRLSPANYHRYSYMYDGKIVGQKRIKGIFHCVRPIVTEKLPVFAQNAREYQVIETENAGKLVQMEVGALLVGRITNHPKLKIGTNIKKGQEKGFFEFGGSTIVVLFKKGRVSMAKALSGRVDENGEIPVVQGEPVAVINRLSD